jgi:glutathione synthase
MRKPQLGVVMDPIAGINPAKDSSLAMLVEAQRRGYALWYFEQQDLRLRDGVAQGSARTVRVADGKTDWFELGTREERPLSALDVILMRKDPPFGTEYIYTTYLLERAELTGVLVVNKPQSLRDMNEKVYTAWFPQCCPATVITRSMADMRAFLAEQGRIVVKPLHGMGGRSIFVLGQGDNNANVVFETLTDYGQQYAMAQTFIPEINRGDKRIILVDGKPVSRVLARIPAPDDNRGNLVAGAQPEVRELTERDEWICAQVGPVLRERGVLFAGLDVIGDYLTEINVTSPTGIRELQKLGGLDVAGTLFDALDARLTARPNARTQGA